MTDKLKQISNSSSLTLHFSVYLVCSVVIKKKKILTTPLLNTANVNVRFFSREQTKEEDFSTTEGTDLH